MSLAFKSSSVVSKRFLAIRFLLPFLFYFLRSYGLFSFLFTLRRTILLGFYKTVAAMHGKNIGDKHNNRRIWVFGFSSCLLLLVFFFLSFFSVFYLYLFVFFSVNFYGIYFSLFFSAFPYFRRAGGWRKGWFCHIGRRASSQGRSITVFPVFLFFLLETLALIVRVFVLFLFFLPLYPFTVFYVASTSFLFEFLDFLFLDFFCFFFALYKKPLTLFTSIFIHRM